MSLLPRALRSASSSSSAAATRAFSTTPARAMVRELGVWDMRDLPTYEWDDPTSLGVMRLQQIEEIRALVSKVELDRKALQAQAKKFRPPQGRIRVTSTIDLSIPDSPYHNKSVLVAPLSSLPLKDADAIHRLKLLAGPRWSPGFPGRHEMIAGSDAKGSVVEYAQDGWVKIAEERFPDGRMNRKSASDMLERLVEAANDASSPLSASTPLDPRHLLARQRKKRGRNGGQQHWARVEALKRRPETVGGVRGFPKEWVPEAPVKNA